jgi:serine/threonine protein phosphatase PrpC
VPYATAIVARFDSTARRLTCVNAGHPAGLLIRGGAEWKLDVGGPPLGLLPGARYEAASLDLHSGDLGVLVTDGVTEALEGSSTTVLELLQHRRRRLSDPNRVDDVCRFLLNESSRAPGPVGAGDWQDDATAFVFRVA